MCVIKCLDDVIYSFNTPSVPGDLLFGKNRIHVFTLSSVIMLF